MDYFDGIVGGAFKKDSQDRNIFYPWGVFGSGVVLESEDQRQKIHALLRTMYQVLFLLLPCSILFQLFLSSWSFLFFAVWYLWYHLKIGKFTQNLPRSEKNIGILESYRNSSKALNLPTLVFLNLIVSGFMIGLWSIRNATDDAYIGIIFFGVLFVVNGCMIFEKIRNR